MKLYLYTLSSSNTLHSVSDNGSPPRFTDTEIIVSMCDVNDNRPMWLSSNYSFSFKENTASGLVLGKVAASDLDANAYSRITYRIETVDTSTVTSNFLIDASSGEIKLNDANVDFENKKQFELVISATDTSTDTSQRSMSLILLLSVFSAHFSVRCRLSKIDK